VAGFGEQQQAGIGSLADQSASSDGPRLKIGPGGRVVIPADLREAMGVVEGDTLLATLVDGELRLMPMAAALAEARALVRDFFLPGGPSVVDELILDRRREQAKEDFKNR
jgi:AbrB family looped-hinge helix DNA binding protein